MKLSKDDRDELDAEVLLSISVYDHQATYVYRNMVGAHNGRWPRITTPAILRACRRLLAAGLIEEDFRRPYAVMKSWRITDAGRHALRKEAPDAHR